MTVFLETERLVIKIPSENDLDDQFKLQSDPDVMQYIATGVRTRSEVDKVLNLCIQHYHKHGFSLGSVYEKKTGLFIGRAGLIYLAFDDKQSDIEVGYALLKSHWRMGYATELTSALVEWGFTHLNVNKLVAVTRPENEKSYRVLEKSGMHFAKMSRYNEIEVNFYEISKEDYESIQFRPLDLSEKKVGHCQYANLKENMLNIFGGEGKRWISQLPAVVDELAKYWKLNHIDPVSNMTFHFVAKALTESNRSVVLKVGYDKNVISSEMRALKYFNGHAAIQLIDFNAPHNALLLQQATPGISLKSLYPSQVEFVMDCYVKTMLKLHQKSLPKNHNFPHIREWLTSIDQIGKDQLPIDLVEKAIRLKNNLLGSLTNEIFLHGDLHHDNILQNGKEWVIIDPKGIVGDAEFEIAAFDFIHNTELENNNLKDLFEKRIALIAQKSNLDFQRIKNWVFIRLILSAAWSIEDNMDASWAINLANEL